MVHPSGRMSAYGLYIRYPFDAPMLQADVSVVICTYGRPDSLNEALKSLSLQTYKDFEVILVTEKGNLAELRQKGLSSSRANLVSFIDDDVYCEPTWLQSIVETFESKKDVVGVTGPTHVTAEYRQNRDIFKFKFARRIYEYLFLDGRATRPSYLSHVGAPSTASNNSVVSYNGEAGYLEACNFTVRRQEALLSGGFDTAYKITAEWSEVDFALRLKEFGILWFDKHAQLFHRPSQHGVYAHRLNTKHRWDNFMRFQHRWIRASFRAYLYRGFVWTYLKMKNLRLI